MINLIIGIAVLMSFCYILHDCVKNGRSNRVWIVNSLNLLLAIFNISAFFK
ncbi:MAG: hypothetical protein ACP5C3_00835 [Methanomicrobiales archaeon]